MLNSKDWAQKTVSIVKDVVKDNGQFLSIEKCNVKFHINVGLKKKKIILIILCEKTFFLKEEEGRTDGLI